MSNEPFAQSRLSTKPLLPNFFTNLGGKGIEKVCELRVHVFRGNLWRDLSRMNAERNRVGPQMYDNSFNSIQFFGFVFHYLEISNQATFSAETAIECRHDNVGLKLVTKYESDVGAGVLVGGGLTITVSYSKWELNSGLVKGLNII